MAQTLKESIEKELSKMLKATGEPSEGRMKLLKTCIGFLAVQAKLEESEYGGFFTEPAGDDPDSHARQKPPGRERKTNGADRDDSGVPEGLAGP